MPGAIRGNWSPITFINMIPIHIPYRPIWKTCVYPGIPVLLQGPSGTFLVCRPMETEKERAVKFQYP